MDSCLQRKGRLFKWCRCIMTSCGIKIAWSGAASSESTKTGSGSKSQTHNNQTFTFSKACCMANCINSHSRQRS